MVHQLQSYIRDHKIHLVTLYFLEIVFDVSKMNAQLKIVINVDGVRVVSIYKKNIFYDTRTIFCIKKYNDIWFGFQNIFNQFHNERQWLQIKRKY